MSSKRYEIDMCSGPLASKILRFAMPLMLASIIQLMFNAVDVVVVSRYVGDNAQAAVSSTSSLVNFLINLFGGLAVGVNVVVAQALGNGDHSKIRAVVHTTVVSATAAGTAMMIFGEIMAPTLLRWMGSPAEIIGMSTQYLRFYCLGLPGALLYNFGSALLRARGDTKRPMYYLTIAGVVNVVLNLIFVVVFHWDVAGVAIATAISKYVAAGLVLLCLMHDAGEMHLDISALSVDWGELKKIVRIGLPAGIQSSMFSLSNITVQSAVNSMGSTVMAGSGAAANIGSFVYVTANAFYSAAMTFVSQNKGAGKPERVYRIWRWSLLYAIIVPTAVGLGAYLFGPQLLGIYTDDPAVIRVGLIRMFWISNFYGVCGMMEATLGTLRGLGYSLFPMFISLFGTCALRIVWVLTVFAAVGTPQSLYCCYPVTWALVGLAFVLSLGILRKKIYADCVGQVSCRS